MNRKNAMPITKILSLLSCAVIASGLVIGGKIITTDLGSMDAWIKGISIILAGLVVSAATRALGNIAQMLFEMSNFYYSQSAALNSQLEALKEQTLKLNSVAQSLKEQSAQIRDYCSGINSDCAQIRKDSISMQDKIDAIDNKEALSHEFLDKGNGTLEKINEVLDKNSCDLKDINKNIFAMQDFFDKIAKHLDFKK